MRAERDRPCYAALLGPGESIPYPTCNEKGESPGLPYGKWPGSDVPRHTASQDMFWASHRRGNRVCSTPSHPGASPQAWESPFHSCPTLGASLWARYQVHPVITYPRPKSDCMCVGGGDPPGSSSQICSHSPRFQCQGSLQPGFPPCAFVSWHKADGSTQGPAHRPVAPPRIVL